MFEHESLTGLAWTVFVPIVNWSGPFYDVRGQFELRYLRDKMKREVDFLVVRDRQPWFLVEVKKADEKLSPALGHFQAETGAPHAFQAIIDLPYVEADCFWAKTPIVVPAKTLLSQLI